MLDGLARVHNGGKVNEKKYSIIFLVLAGLLFSLFALYNYTDILITHEKPAEDDKSVEQIEMIYSYIKSHDINKKTKISFLINKDAIISDIINDEYGKEFNSENGLTILARSVNDTNSIDLFANKELNRYKNTYSNDEYVINSSDISCNNVCKHYQFLKDNKIYMDIIEIYIKASDEDISVITYQMNNKELSQELINDIINSIKITYDAIYKIGVIENNKLIIKLKKMNDEIIKLILDNNVFEEVESKSNTSAKTIVKNKNNGSLTYITLHFKRLDLNIKDDIDMYHNMTDPGSNVTEIMVDDKKVYQYDLGNHNSYAYIINDDYALLISPDSNSTSISDFLNFNS